MAGKEPAPIKRYLYNGKTVSEEGVYIQIEDFFHGAMLEFFNKSMKS